MSNAFKVTINITLDTIIDVIAPDGAVAHDIGVAYAGEIVPELLEAHMKEQGLNVGGFFYSPVIEVCYEDSDEDVEYIEDWAFTPEYLEGEAS
jgi:hypothetical protein